MGRIVEVKLPDVGEGIAEGEVSRWLVKEGDMVKRFQPIVEVITAKATVEIPSPYEGRVVELLAKEGEIVKVGEPILKLEVSDSKGAEEVVEEERVEEEAGRMEEKRVEVATPTRSEAVGVVMAEKRRVRAPPSVRMLARRLGIDLSMVEGTGPRGVITKDDVLRYAQTLKARGASGVEERIEERVEERVPLRGIKRIMAERMTQAKSSIPHAYLVEEVDVTELMEVREKLKMYAEGLGVKLTILPFIVKAVVIALKEYPLMNATIDMDSQEIIVKKYYNIGIAVDTPQGLVVPNVKDADKKDIFTLAREIAGLAEKAREGRLSLDEVTGSTFSISNYGAIGSIAGFPIINPPESAILGVGRIREEPRYIDGRLEPRKLVYITVSFDHRIIEGGYAIRFAKRVKELLENPLVLLALDPARQTPQS